MIGTTGTARMKWYELCPYMGQSRSTDMETILDHMPEFVLVIAKDVSRVRVHIRAPPERLPLLDSLKMAEPVESEPPTLYGYTHTYRYETVRHCALPVAPKDAVRSSIYQIMGNSVTDSAYLMISLKKATYFPQISQYVERLQAGRSPGVSGLISEFVGSRGKPGPTKLSRIALAREKAASRHLFRAHIVVAAGAIRDMEAIESVFPSAAFKQASSPRKTDIERISLRGPGQPILGGSHSPILSDSEILSFVCLPDEDDMAAAPMNFGRMPSHSGGERLKEYGATRINIERG